MKKTLVEGIRDRIKGQKSARITFESHWDDIARFVYPSQEFNTRSTPGEKRNRRIFDTTALNANEMLAGALHALLVSPSTPWFSLTLRDTQRRVNYREQRWLDDTSRRMYALFNSEQSGFNSAVHELFMSLGAFGNGCFYEEYSPRTGVIRFHSFALRDVFIGEDADGVINMLYRRICATASVMVQKLGNRTPESIRKIADKNPDTKVEIWHCVEPTGMFADHPDINMPYISAYYYEEGKELIGEPGGYMSFPYQFPRWSKRSGESYGFGPGGKAYPDVAMLQRIKEVTIRAAEKQVDPPLLVPHDSVIGTIVIEPAGVINYNATTMGDGGIRPLEMNSRPLLADKILNDIQTQVREAFYVEWINLPQRGPQMTATEVLQRRDEYMRLLSPMLSRLNSEFTGPLIERTFQLMLRHGMVDAPPESLAGADMKIEYLSPIAQAQRMTEMDSVMRSLQLALGMVEFDPMIIQNFDLDTIVRETSIDINRLPSKYLRSPEEIAGLRQAVAQQQAAAQQAQLSQMQADTAKSGTQAQKNQAQALTLQ